MTEESKSVFYVASFDKKGSRYLVEDCELLGIYPFHFKMRTIIEAHTSFHVDSILSKIVSITDRTTRSIV